MRFKRVLSGLFLGAVFVSAILWLPRAAALPAMVLLYLLAALEFGALLDAAALPHFRLVNFFGGLALLGAAWFSPDEPTRNSLVLLATLGVFFAICLRQFMQLEDAQPIHTMGNSLLSFFYIPFLFHFIPMLLLLTDYASGRHWLLYAVVVTKCCDIGAYTVGMTLGRHKLIPRISPAKTWEGFVGGLVFACAASVAFLLLTDKLAHWNMGVGTGMAAGLGVLLALAGTAGDLVESQFKRAAGVKDSSNLIPGMGGILDVLDSLFFAVPVLYFVLRLAS